MTDQIQENSGTATKPQPWWDEATEAPNLSRMLVGRTLAFGDAEQGQAERTCTIASILDYAVGLDMQGIFCAIQVVTSDGDVVNLYSDGLVTDSEEQELGRHDIKDTKEDVAA